MCHQSHPHRDSCVEGLRLELGEKLVPQPLFIFHLKRMCDPTAPLLSLFQTRFCMLGPYRSIYFGPWLALLKDVGLDRKRHWPVKRGPSFSSFKYSFNFKAFKLMRSTNKHTASYSYNTYISRKSKQVLSWAPSVFFLFDLRPHPNRNACNSRASGPCTRAWTVKGCLCIASSLAFAAGRHRKLRVGRVPARFAASGNQG